MSDGLIRIGGDAITVAINPTGAELWSITDTDGGEWMTDADPAFWTGHAPLLFPIVGALAGGVYRLDGVEYPLPQHGFARRMPWAVTAHEPGGAAFRLQANDETRAVYPFDFALDALFSVTGAKVDIAITATNTGDADMPASFGFHPAFAWPLPGGGAREDYRIMFDHNEFGNLSLLEGGEIVANDRPSPLENGHILRLDDALFERDALIWSDLASRSVAYGAPGKPGLRVDFPDAHKLGIWTKPGSRFVCIEPWWGIADPAGFAGEIWDKPGILRIAPGESRRFAIGLTIAA